MTALDRMVPFRRRLLWCAAAAGWLAAAAVPATQGPLSPTAMREHPAIGYSRTAPTDVVSRLNTALRDGAATLEFDPATGYLKAVLAAFGVPIESQLLVFSKTSFQARRISPANPRAIYFNDVISVGWVRGGDVVEVVVQDPRQGAMFYTLDQTPAARPEFTRNLVCVQCHTSDATLNVPGMFLGSVHPGPDGTALYAPTYTTDHRSPFETRWGGWFVTGHHRLDRHMGNAVVPDPRTLTDMITPESVHMDSLQGRFDPAGYLSLSSDIAALLVLEHQARMANLITRVGWESRLGADAGRPLDPAVGELVDYLLFVDEQPLPGSVEGPTAFTRNFSARGPRDRLGRSLHELALDGRLMRYPCSYMIYSEQFAALPEAAKTAIYARLWAVLSGAATEPRYRSLTPGDRRAIVDILSDTKPDLPGYFQQPPPHPASAGSATPAARAPEESPS